MFYNGNKIKEYSSGKALCHFHWKRNFPLSFFKKRYIFLRKATCKHTLKRKKEHSKKRNWNLEKSHQSINAIGL